VPGSADSSEVVPPGLWAPPEPGKLVGRGHGVGDFLEAYAWDVLERREGVLRVIAHLPERVRNPRGQLFGGFTPTYVDFVAIHTWWAGREEARPGRPWLATLSMRVDYFAPVVTDRFEIDSRVVHRRGSTSWIETRFLPPDPHRAGPAAHAAHAVSGARSDPDPARIPDPDPEGEMLVFAYTTLKALRKAG